jgi:hypothetical protein
VDNLPICKICLGYMLDFEDPKLKAKGWKKCVTCGYCEKFRYNGEEDEAQ